jgi:hypothetical protein
MFWLRGFPISRLGTPKAWELAKIYNTSTVGILLVFGCKAGILL